MNNNNNDVHVDLLSLPHFANGSFVDWKNSIGLLIPFKYYDINGELKIVDYIKGKHSKVKIEYCDNYYTIYVDDLKKGQIGKLLSCTDKNSIESLKERKKQEKIQNDIKFSKGDIINDGTNNVTILSSFIKKDNIYYFARCNICGNKIRISQNMILQGKRLCRDYHNADELKNKLFICRPDLKIYFDDEDEFYSSVINGRKSITYRCPICGKKKIIPIRLLVNGKYICEYCNKLNSQYNTDYQKDKISYPNKFMYNLLDQLKNMGQISNFDREVRFDWCIYYNKFKDKNTFGIYDFVIEELKLIIEMDGSFHYKTNRMSGQTAEESKFLDDVKDKLAFDNGYKIIRINCDYDANYNLRSDLIKNNILDSKLNKIFNMENINWNYISLKSENPMFVEISKYYNDNPKSKFSDIAEKFGVCVDTVKKNLEIGSSYNLCNYDKEEHACMIRSKEIAMYKNGELIDVFPNAQNIEDVSLERFGILLFSNGCRHVANKERKQYKGYTFEYI